MDRKFKVALIYVGPQFVAFCMSPVRNLEIWGSCQILLKILHLWFKPLFVLEIRTQREMRHWSQFFFYLNFMCVIYLCVRKCDTFKYFDKFLDKTMTNAAARLLRSWDRIPPGAWIFVCCECRVLSGRGLCDELITRPEESYRLWCVVVCDLETSRAGAPYIYIWH